GLPPVVCRPSSVVRRPLRSSLPLALVVDPEAGGAEDQEREGKDDDEEDPGEGRAVADLELLEGFAVEVEAVEEGRILGAAGAAEEDEGRGKDLEGADDSHDQIEKDDGREHGERHRAELGEDSRAVDLGGVVKLSG